MTTEKELKERCTPNDIKCMVELAEGFEFCNSPTTLWFGKILLGDVTHKGVLESDIFPLLIHRAVEGWNKSKNNYLESIDISFDCIERKDIYEYLFFEYQPQSLTQPECAMLNCLLDIFKEEKK